MAGSGAGTAKPRTIRVFFRGEWAPAVGNGLLAADTRVRTLRKVLVTYPDVRHVLPDTISLEPTTDSRTIETLTRFLQRQTWLVKSVVLE